MRLAETRVPTTYWDYIRVEELLALQGGVERDETVLGNDEVLFITIHQIDELWFKLMVREIVAIRNLFARPTVPEQALASAVRSLRRTALLLHNVAQHFALMETMTTRDYLAFRDKLSPASGFQSAQLREIEILLGLDEGDRIPLGHERSVFDALRTQTGEETPASRRVAARLLDRPSLRESLHRWLARTPIRGSTPGQPGDAEVVRRFVEDYLAAHHREAESARTQAIANAVTPADRERLARRFEAEIEGARRFLLAEGEPEQDREPLVRLRAALVFIESYRELPLLAWPREVVDGVVAMEQAFLIFRQRHARMVERVIGRRTGTGGSAGVDYLDHTALAYRIFREVWAVRTLLIRNDALPPLAERDFYDFAEGR